VRPVHPDEPQHGLLRRQRGAAPDGAHLHDKEKQCWQMHQNINVKK
jgi:hypothetical protein